MLLKAAEIISVSSRALQPAAFLPLKSGAVSFIYHRFKPPRSLQLFTNGSTGQTVKDLVLRTTIMPLALSLASLTFRYYASRRSL